MDEKKIMENLKDHWNYAVNLGYNEDRFLGVFAQNNKSLIVILPSFKDLCSLDFLSTKLTDEIYVKDIRLLLDIKDFEFNLYILNSKYEELFKTYFVKELNMSEGIVEILKYSFLEKQQQIISKKEFFNQLTNAEIKAYYSIIKEIGTEGNITISKLVTKNSISRPVYNNLIVKMKENQVASVVNMGMKGTYIKILETELKAEAYNYDNN